MKEVLAGKGNHEPCGISKELNWQGGGFFKYYELEQYEDTLRKVKYEDEDLFDNPYLYSSLQTELIDEQFFEFVVDIFSL